MKTVLTNLRNLFRRYPVASALNVVGLAVAFAAFTVIMMQVRYDLRYDGFYPDAKKIFRLEVEYAEMGFVPIVSLPLAEALPAGLPQIERAGVVTPTFGKTTRVAADEQNFVEQPLIYHRMAMLSMLDLRIVAGDTTRLHAPATVIIPRSTAQKLYPGGEDPVGRQIALRTEDWSRSRIPTVEIVAVYEDLPDNSAFAGAMFMEIPEGYNGDTDNWAAPNYGAFFQIDPRQKEAVTGAIAGFIASSPDIPEQLKSIMGNVRLTAIGDMHLQNDLARDRLVTEKANRGTVYTMLSIAILIILIAAINFINFATAMVPMRLRAVNMQRVLGSSVWQIRWAMIGEAVGLAAVALGIGLFVVYGLTTTSFFSLMDFDPALGKHLPALGLTCVVALATGALAGIWPAFYIASFPPAMVLKGSFALSPRGKRMRTALVSVQYLISIALIVGALFIQAHNKYMRDYPLGFEQHNLLTTTISFDLAQRREALTDELGRNAAITEVAYASELMVGENFRGGTKVDPASGQDMRFEVLSVTHNFPAMMGLEITGGRDFVPSDGGRLHSLIFNETARRALSLEVGEELGRIGGMENSVVVGFMNDYHFKPLHYAVEPMAVGVLTANADGRMLTQVFIRVAAGADLAAVIDHIESSVKALDPAQTEVDVRMVDSAIGDLYARENRLARLVTLFSALAVFISMIGVFGLVLFETQFRRREIGIRKVHGASVGDILRLLNSGFVRIVVLCFVVAAPVAWWAVVRWQQGFAFRPPVQWWVFAAALGAVLVVTTLTVSAQSYRAATDNPVNALHME